MLGIEEIQSCVVDYFHSKGVSRLIPMQVDAYTLKFSLLDKELFISECKPLTKIWVSKSGTKLNNVENTADLIAFLDVQFNSKPLPKIEESTAEHLWGAVDELDALLRDILPDLAPKLGPPTRDVLNALATGDDDLTRGKAQQHDGAGERAKDEPREHVALIGHLPGVLRVEAVEVERLPRLHRDVDVGDNILHVVADDVKGLAQVIRTQDVAHAVGGQQPLIPAARAGHHELARREEQACAHWIGQTDGDGGELRQIV